MKAQKTRQARTGIVHKHGHITFDAIGNLIKFRHHIANPANLQGAFSRHAVDGVRPEEKEAFNLEAERRRAMGRTYSNMIPPR